MKSCWTLVLLFTLAGADGCASSPAGTDSAAPLALAAGSTPPDACLEHLQTAHRFPGGDSARALAEEIDRFQTLAESALSYRQSAIELVERLQAKADGGEPLAGSDLELLRVGTVTHLDLRARLWAMAEAHECWITLADAELDRYGLTAPMRDEGVMMSLAAALVLYDNYLLIVALYEQDSKLRRILNQEDKGYALPRHRLTEATLLFLSPGNRERVGQAIDYYRRRVAPRLDEDTSAARAYLAQLITQSPSYASLARNTLPKFVGEELSLLQTLSADLISRLSSEGVSLFSMLFGNTVGLVETRKGRLYRQREVEQELLATLQPGDILLEKTPFRLTDLMIPGYWGHAAIWTGGESELRAMGIWRHPAVLPYQSAIRADGRIVEALRSGVKLSTLHQFLNVDDLVVLRPRTPEPDVQTARVVRAFRQLGKAYDFNFDVESTDRIVCSELVYQVYTEMPWPTSKLLGRATISPDQVAVRALADGPLRVVALYRNGQAQPADTEELMQTVFRREYATDSARAVVDPR